jgi:hypothetical protein
MDDEDGRWITVGDLSLAAILIHQTLLPSHLKYLCDSL